MSIIVNLSGIKQVENALKNLDTFLIKELSNEINASALKIQKDAKRAAPVDNGFLRNNIALTKDTDLTFTVESKAKYSPYIEFGTGGLVEIPAGYEEIAAQFKGKGIKKINLRARPFLIPSFENEVPKLLKRLKKLINAQS
jgi:HK97 gp10 family phage protein